MRPDPLTAGIADIDRELLALERRWRLPSFVVAERGVAPEGIDGKDLAWWRFAFDVRVRRVRELAVAPPKPPAAMGSITRKQRGRIG